MSLVNADLSSVTAVTPVEIGRYRTTVADGWQQGRGAFGGLVLGQLTRALSHTLGVPHWPLRSLAAQLPAPALPGEAEVRTEELRRGKGTATLFARLLQGGRTVAAATAVFGQERCTDREWTELARPDAAGWKDRLLRRAARAVGRTRGPGSAQSADLRLPLKTATV